MKSRKKHPLLIIISISAIAIFKLISCESKEDDNSLDSSKNSNVNSTIVTNITAEKKSFEHCFEIQGQVISKKNILLLPEIGGIVESINVVEGQLVQKNQLIATYSSELLISNMEELEEQLELAKYILNKQTNLFEQGLGTELQLKEVTANYNALLKTKQTMLKKRDKYSVFAPFSGFVDQVFASVGQLGGPASPIIRLVNLDELFVVADVSENYLSSINEGQKVNVTFPALDLKIENLKVSRIGKQINPVNRTVVVESKIETNNKKIIPNLMAIINLRDHFDSNAVVIPSRVILNNSTGLPVVKLIDDQNKVQIKSIVTGLHYKNETQILEGLNPGDIIIDEGKGSVVEGQNVNVIISNSKNE